MSEQGLVLLFTGDGKGKTTAALGLAVRALGNQQKVCVIQFLKGEEFPTGELMFLKQLDVEIYPCGKGLTWKNSDEANKQGIKCAFDLAIEKLNDQSYDLVILDEINNTLAISEFDISDECPMDELIKCIQVNRAHKSIVLTGRNAPEQLCEIADLITEMKSVKHYYDKGIMAKKGIEY